MVQINLTNSECIITSDTYTPSQLYTLIDRETMVRDPKAYFSPAYKYGTWDGYVHLITKFSLGITVPTGWLERVITVFQDSGIEYEIIDKRENYFNLQEIHEKEYYLGEILVRDYQIEAYNSIIKNTLAGFPFQRGIINIATNGGKTTIAGVFLQEMMNKLLKNRKSVLFLTHSLEIANQTQKRFSVIFGEDNVARFSRTENRYSPIIIGTVQTLANLVNKRKKEWEKFNENIWGLIVDECHHTKSSSFQTVIGSLTNAYIRIGLSGTVAGDKLGFAKIEGVIGGVTIKVTNDELIRHGYSAKCICMFLPVLTNTKIPDEWDYKDVYDFGVIKLKSRLNLISICVERELLDNRKTLILIDRIEHGKIIMNYLKSRIQSLRIEFTNGGKDKDYREQVLQDLREDKVDVLIASTVLDEGIDVSNINSVIYARGGLSDRKILQGLGRGLRQKKDNSYLHYYDFIDTSHRYLFKHSKSRINLMIDQRFSVKILHPQHIIFSSWEIIKNLRDEDNTKRLVSRIQSLVKPSKTTNKLLLDKIGEQCPQAKNTG